MQRSARSVGAEGRLDVEADAQRDQRRPAQAGGVLREVLSDRGRVAAEQSISNGRKTEMLAAILRGTGDFGSLLFLWIG